MAAEHQVTVFGGTGFLGRRLVRRLAEAGWRVRAASRHPGDADAGAGQNVAPYPADVTDAESVEAAVAGARAVVNVVGLYAEDRGQTFDAVHVDGAARVARAARAAGAARMVHVSGIGADPRSPSRYVAARGRGEAAVAEAMPAAAIVRPSVLFGPRDVFLSTLDAVTRLRLVPLFGRGITRLQPVHVGDAAAALAALAAAEAPPPGPFELGGADVVSYRSAVERVAAHRGRRCLLLPVPFAAWHALAAACRALPRAPLTRDQVILMERDNVAAAGSPGFAALGLEPRGLTMSLGECLGPPA